MDISSILILFLCGCIGGYLSGLLGVGGGIVFVPILTIVLKKAGIEGEELVKYVLANSLGTIFFAGVISTLKQYKMHHFYPKQILLTASLAMITSAITTQLIVNKHWYSAKLFSIIFVVLLIIALMRYLFKTKVKTVEVADVAPQKFLLTGFLTGFITALSGLGGGVVMIPLFSYYIKIPIRKAAAISIGVIPLIIIPILISYGMSTPIQLFSDNQIGYILPYFIFPLIAGLIFAAPIGVASSHKISEKKLQIIFASLIVIVIIHTIGNIIQS